MSWIIRLDPECNRKGLHMRRKGRLDPEEGKVRCYTVGFEDGGKGLMGQGLQLKKLEKTRVSE